MKRANEREYTIHIYPEDHHWCWFINCLPGSMFTIQAGWLYATGAGAKAAAHRVLRELNLVEKTT
jgi:hypothetical protein